MSGGSTTATRLTNSRWRLFRCLCAGSRPGSPGRPGRPVSPLLKRAPSLAEIGNVAVLMASDYASPMTATVAKMTCGSIVD